MERMNQGGGGWSEPDKGKGKGKVLGDDAAGSLLGLSQARPASTQPLDWSKVSLSIQVLAFWPGSLTRTHSF